VAYSCKVYVVQKADRDGTLGRVLAAKLTFQAAHAIAKRFAPARVHVVDADKTEDINGEHYAHSDYKQNIAD
jgi:hypothetical protein